MRLRLLRLLRLLSLLMLATLGALAAAQERPQRPEVERLVRAFGAVDMFQGQAAHFLRTARQPASPAARKDHLLLERIVAARPEELLPAFVDAFGQALSPGEVAEMTEALETPIGRKVIALSIEASRRDGGISIATWNPRALSEEERRQADELAAMPGWKTYLRVSKNNAVSSRIPGAILALPLFAEFR